MRYMKYLTMSINREVEQRMDIYERRNRIERENIILCKDCAERYSNLLWIDVADSDTQCDHCGVKNNETKPTKIS
jgi:hypothetical protein